MDGAGRWTSGRRPDVVRTMSGHRTLSVAALTVLLAALVAPQATTTRPHHESADSFVASITEETFDDVLGESRAGVFVNFYMPWCKYSKRLTLDYELLGHAFQRVREVKVGKVNCEEEKPLCERFDVKGYPTLLWFPRGSSTTGEVYKGGRSSQEMMNFLNDKSGVLAKPKRRPNKIELLTSENFKEVIQDESRDAIVQFFIPGDEVCKHFEVEYDMLATALNSETHVDFWVVNARQSPDVIASESVQTFPMVKMYRRAGRGSLTYTGRYTAASLLPWVNERAETSRLLSGVSNNTVGLVAALDALVDRLVRSPPNAWASQAQSLRKTVEKLEGKDREHGDFYLEAIGDLTGDKELLAEKRLELNERIVLEKDPSVRAQLQIQRNVVAVVMGKAQRAGMLDHQAAASVPAEQKKAEKQTPNSRSMDEL